MKRPFWVFAAVGAALVVAADYAVGGANAPVVSAFVSAGLGLLAEQIKWWLRPKPPTGPSRT